MPVAEFDRLTARDGDLYDVYRRLRAEAPVYRNGDRDFFALSRFADVQAAARDWTTHSSARGVNLDDTLSLTGPGNFISADPPDHDRCAGSCATRPRPRACASSKRWSARWSAPPFGTAQGPGSSMRPTVWRGLPPWA